MSRYPLIFLALTRSPFLPTSQSWTKYNSRLNRVDAIEPDEDEPITGTRTSIAPGDDRSGAESTPLTVAEIANTTHRSRNTGGVDDIASTRGGGRDDSDAESTSPPVSPLVTWIGDENAATRDSRSNDRTLSQELMAVGEEQQPPVIVLSSVIPPPTQGILGNSVRETNLSDGTGASSTSSPKNVRADDQTGTTYLDDVDENLSKASGQQQQAPMLPSESFFAIPNRHASKADSDSCSGSAAVASGQNLSLDAPRYPLQEITKDAPSTGFDAGSLGAGDLTPATPRAFIAFTVRDQDTRVAAPMPPLPSRPRKSKSMSVIMAPTSSSNHGSPPPSTPSRWRLAGSSDIAPNGEKSWFERPQPSAYPQGTALLIRRRLRGKKGSRSSSCTTSGWMLSASLHSPHGTQISSLHQEPTMSSTGDTRGNPSGPPEVYDAPFRSSAFENHRCRRAVGTARSQELGHLSVGVENGRTKRQPKAPASSNRQELTPPSHVLHKTVWHHPQRWRPKSGVGHQKTFNQ